MGRDNPSGADNQQERSGVEQWAVGFVDGEGCFSISVVRNPGCRLGWQVQHEFSVTQASSSRAALELLQEVFGCGTILEQHRADNHRVSLCRFSVKRRAQLVGSVVPFFEERPLRTAKRADFEQFALVLQMMGRGRASARSRAAAHCLHHGDDESQAAVSVPGILRGHTPAGSHRWRVEEMVLASWRHEGN
jgi:hypothetical protein